MYMWGRAGGRRTSNFVLYPGRCNIYKVNTRGKRWGQEDSNSSYTISIAVLQVSSGSEEQRNGWRNVLSQ